MRRLIILLCATALMGCGGGDDPVVKTDNSVSLERTAIEFGDVAGQWIAIESSESWEVSLEFEDGIAAWASLGSTEGSEDGLVRLSNQRNTGTAERSVVIVVDFGSGEKKTATLTQNFDENKKDDDKIYKWIEMPKIDTTSGHLYRKHFMTYNGKLQRNYSLLYDTTMMVALWVGYPMHDSYYDTKVKREEDYNPDPSIPTWMQPNLDKSYTPNGNPYNRGHLVPSADRQATVEMNKQVFFCSNIAPQIPTFNTGRWGKVENKLREMVQETTDTIWVVMGCVFRTVGGSEDIVEFNNQSSNTPNYAPNYFYKIALMYDNGTYKGIGFWFDHFDTEKYSGTYTNTLNDNTMTLTIDEIEAKTGFDFFVNLSTEQQAAAEGSVDKNFWK